MAKLTGVFLLVMLSLNTSAEVKSDEYRLTAFPTYRLTDDHRWIGIGYLGYVTNHEDQYDIAYLGLGTIWRFRPKAEFWTLVLNVRTDNENSPDVSEYRPVVGLKNYFVRTNRVTFYNLARLEYRIEDVDGAEDNNFFRFRNRLGTEFHFTDKSNEPGALYGIADIELFYRTDKDISDLARLRGGLGWIMGDRVRAELIYHMQLSRDAGEHFAWTENIWRLNFKVSRHHGLLQRLDFDN